MAFAGLVRSDRQFGGHVWSAAGDLRRSISVELSQALAAGTTSYSPNGSWVLLGEQLINVDSNEARLTTLAGVFRNHPFFRVDDSGLRVANLFEMGLDLVGVELAQTSEPANRRVIGSLPERHDSSNIDGAVLSLAVSPDGTRLVTASPTGPGRSLLWSINADFERSTILGLLPVELPLEVDFSPDSKRVAVSGDGWGLFSAEAAGPAVVTTPPPPSVDFDCWFNFARFARRGTLLARGSYAATVDIFKDDLATPITSLPTARCNGRASFASDDSLLATSGPELYRTSDWSRIWPAQVVPETPSGAAGLPPNDDIRFAPDDQSLLRTACESFARQCKHELYDLSGTRVRALPELSAARAGFSREGHWIVSGNALLHLPTNELRSFEPRAKQSTFAPNGDIVSVLDDNTLARYCRTSPNR